MHFIHIEGHMISADEFLLRAFQNLESDDSPLVDTCEGCQFAISNVQNLRIEIEEEFRKKSALFEEMKEKHQNLEKEHQNLEKEVRRLKSVAVIRDFEIKIADGITHVYNNIWRFIYDMRTEYISRTSFF